MVEKEEEPSTRRTFSSRWSRWWSTGGPPIGSWQGCWRTSLALVVERAVRQGLLKSSSNPSVPVNLLRQEAVVAEDRRRRKWSSPWSRQCRGRPLRSAARPSAWSSGGSTTEASSPPDASVGPGEPPSRRTCARAAA